MQRTDKAAESPIKIIAFYKFLPIDKRRLPTLKESFSFEAQRNSVRGLIVLAEEGINGTVAGPSEELAKFKSSIIEKLEILDLPVKVSSAENNPFKRFKVDIRKEIVTLGKQVPLPKTSTPSHLSAKDWHDKLTSGDDDFILLDVRNHYESLLGHFKNSELPGLNSFGEFPDYIEKAKIPKNKKILMYCTGGIRCEKASLEMNKQGYEQVFQLQGGILKYLEEYPNEEYDGECFVFDNRVAVNQDLEPSTKYHLCPHCGDPGALPIACRLCEKRAVICDRCARIDAYRTCSKNCRYHFENNKAANS